MTERKIKQKHISLLLKLGKKNNYSSLVKFGVTGLRKIVLLMIFLSIKYI